MGVTDVLLCFNDFFGRGSCLTYADLYLYN